MNHRDACRIAVLVIDLQREFIGDDAVFPVPMGRRLPTSIGTFAAVMRAAGATMIATRYMLPDGVPEGRTTARLQTPNAHRGVLADFADGVSLQPGDVLLDKPRMSAFVGTSLELTLRRRDIDSVVLTGLTTHMCVLSTAFDAAARDFDVTVLEDLTACSPSYDDGRVRRSADDSHEAALDLIRHGIGRVTTSQVLLSELGLGADAPV